MIIHHYTSIDSLALILKNKTIRFNRLDNVDDMDEARTESSGIKFSKYTFVSCWTNGEEESIPLWKIYTGKDMKGVKISLDHDMFKKYLIKKGRYPGIEVLDEGDFFSRIPFEKLIGDKYLVNPTINNDDFFFRPIKYIDNVHEEYNKIAKVSNTGLGGINVSTRDMGLYKHKHWAFQKEYRFTITIFPTGSNDPIMASIIMGTAISSNLDVPFMYYDLNLSDSSLDSLTITLSPTCTEAERAIVESLVSRYAPLAKIANSDLAGRVR